MRVTSPLTGCTGDGHWEGTAPEYSRLRPRPPSPKRHNTSERDVFCPGLPLLPAAGRPARNTATMTAQPPSERTRLPRINAQARRVIRVSKQRGGGYREPRRCGIMIRRTSFEGRSMWWKLPLLILLCAPLGFRAWQEIAAHGEDDPPRPEVLPREELARQKTQLASLKEELDAQVINVELTSEVFRVSNESLGGSARRLRAFEQPLARTLHAHLEVVRDIRHFADIYADLENDPARQAECRDPDLKAWLDTRRSQVKTRKARENALAADLVVLTDKVRAAVRRRDTTTIKLAEEDVEDVLARLHKHRGDCSGVPVLAAWAERRVVEWRAYGNLLAVAQDDALVMKDGGREEVLRHVARYARLLEQMELEGFVRDEAKRFCEGYLPPWLEGENRVIYRGISVPREHIHIKWKKDSPEAKKYPGGEIQLNRTAYDEFKPPDLSQVQYYFRPANSGDDDFYGQIKPTPHNEAARHYNQGRKTLRWNATSLE